MSSTNKPCSPRIFSTTHVIETEPVVVDSRFIMSYAAGLLMSEDTMSSYFNTTEPELQAAHPLLYWSISWPVIAKRMPEFLIDGSEDGVQFLRNGVHYGEDVVHHSALAAGAVISVRCRICQISQKRKGCAITLKFELTDSHARLILTHWTTTYFRDVVLPPNEIVTVFEHMPPPTTTPPPPPSPTTSTTTSTTTPPITPLPPTTTTTTTAITTPPPPVPSPPPPQPSPPTPSSPSPPPPRSITSITPITPITPITSIAIPIAWNEAWVYTECSHIWNPIHTDVAVARRFGLPQPILHGTSHLAKAVSSLTTLYGYSRPLSVKRVQVKAFGANVLMPSTLTLCVLNIDGPFVRWELVTENGQLAIRGGLVQFDSNVIKAQL